MSEKESERVTEVSYYLATEWMSGPMTDRGCECVKGS